MGIAELGCVETDSGGAWPVPEVDWRICSDATTDFERSDPDNAVISGYYLSAQIIPSPITRDSLLF